jgi:hypothetical protein
MNLEEKRIKLFQDFRADAVDNGFEGDFDKKYPTFDTWQNVNFKNDTSVLALWNKALKDIIGPTSKELFFKTFACDILPTSNYCIQEGFPKCASRMGKAQTGYLGFGKTYIEYTSKITAWGNPQVRLFQSTDGKTGPYEILSGTKKGGTGSYSCTASGATLLGVPVMPNTTPANTTTTPAPTPAPTPVPTTPGKTTPTTPDKTTPTPNRAKIVTKSPQNPNVSGSDAIIY